MYPPGCYPSHWSGNFIMEVDFPGTGWLQVEQCGQGKMTQSIRAMVRSVGRPCREWIDGDYRDVVYEDPTVRVYNAKSRFIAYQGPLSGFQNLRAANQANERKVDNFDVDFVRNNGRPT